MSVLPTEDVVRACASNYDERLAGGAVAFDGWLAEHDRQLLAYIEKLEARMPGWHKRLPTRLEDQQADIIGWFAFNKTEAIRTVVEAGQALIADREGDEDPESHDHEFENCCVICGKTWHEVNP